jgi:hypothetical protein
MHIPVIPLTPWEWDSEQYNDRFEGREQFSANTPMISDKHMHAGHVGLKISLGYSLSTDQDSSTDSIQSPPTPIPSASVGLLQDPLSYICLDKVYLYGLYHIDCIATLAGLSNHSMVNHVVSHPPPPK